MTQIQGGAQKSNWRKVIILGLVAAVAYVTGSVAGHTANGPPATGVIVGLLAATVAMTVGIFVIYRSARTVMPVTTTVVGSVEVVGYCLWMIFVSSFGRGGVWLWGGITWEMWIVLFLLSGPMSLFLGSVLAMSRPRWAGYWLVIAGVCTTILAVLVMTPIPSTWSPGGDSLWVYSCKWSLTLIVPFSLPMLIYGSWLVLKRHTIRTAEQPSDEPVQSR